MTRPGTRLSTFYKKIDQDRDYYLARAERAENAWAKHMADLDDETVRRVSFRRVGQLISHRDRLTDKLNLFKTLIADAIGKNDGSLTDHDALLILAGWAREHWAVHHDEEE